MEGNWSIGNSFAAVAPYRTWTEDKEIGESKSPIFPAPVFNAPAEGVSLGTGYRRKGSKTRTMGYRTLETVFIKIRLAV